jgi:glycosyltransferase involved in cell wall biosynthesis
LEPVRALAARAEVYGVRYPDSARAALARVGISYGGFLPNALVPRTLARFKATVHVPRGPYARALPGIPTIRVFEALACGIPDVTSNISSLPEAGEGLALTVEPGPIEELAGAILQAFTDEQLRHRCRSEAATIATQFSAKRMVEQTIAAYEQAAGLPRLCRHTQDVSLSR